MNFELRKAELMKTNIRITQIARLITFLTLVTSVAAKAGNSDGGGGNDIEATFYNAAAIVSKALTENPRRSLSKNTKKIIDEHKSRLVSEFNGLNLSFDHNSTSHFQHNNGSETWIQTSFIPFARIEIRTKVMQQLLGSPNLEALMSYLAHEVGHHIVGADEAKSWEISSAVSEYVQHAVKFPYMLKITGPEYIGLSVGCRDQAHIEADPFTGVLVVSSQSTGHCVSLLFTKENGRGFERRPSPTQYDDRVITFLCKEKQSRTICKPDGRTTRSDEHGYSTHAEVLIDGNVTVTYEFFATVNSVYIGSYQLTQKYIRK
jgi:hypothetical protein